MGRKTSGRSGSSRRECGGCLARAAAIVLLAFAVLAAGGFAAWRAGILDLSDLPFVPFKAEGSSRSDPNERDSPDTDKSGEAAPLAEDPAFITLDGSYTDSDINDVDGARDSLEPFADSWGIQDIDRDLTNTGKQDVLGDRVYRFAQMHRGVPVYGRSAVVVARGGHAQGLTANLADVSSVDTEPALSPEDALSAAGAPAQSGADRGDASASLVIYSLDGIDPVLAYQVDTGLHGADPQRTFVNAETGDIVARESLAQDVAIKGKTNGGKTVDVEVQQEGDDWYRLNDGGNNIQIYDAAKKEPDFSLLEGRDDSGATFDIREVRDENGNLTAFYFTDEEGEDLHDDGDGHDGYKLWRDNPDEPVSLSAYISEIGVRAGGEPIDPYAGKRRSYRSTDAGKVATSLYDAIRKTYGFYSNTLGRRGFDGQGGQTVGVVRAKLTGSSGGDDSTNANAANFGPHITRVVVGYKNKIELDVIAHELGHSLEGSLAGIIGGGERGAIKEAVGDVLGELTEDYADDGKMNATCDWKSPFRDIANPQKSKAREGLNGASEHPSRYGDKYWGDPYADGASERDNGYVHNNSTVISHALYLMFKSNLAGADLRTEQLARLLYATLSRLPRNCSMREFRAVMESVATTLDGIDADRAMRVSAAFDEAGIDSMDPTYQVERGATLEVFDVNKRPYAQYDARISALWGDKTPSTLKVAKDGTGRIEVREPGLYRVTLTDTAGSGKTKALKVRVLDGGDPSLSVYTDFGTKLSTEELEQAERENPTPRNAVLVLDVSSSMKGEREQALQSAAKRFVDEVDLDRADVGIVTYATDPDTAAKLGSDKDTLQRAAKRVAVDPQGDTNIESGLRDAVSMLAAARGQKTIVLMSDGEANRGAKGSELVAYANGLKEQGYRIFTVGFNLADDQKSTMTAMASDDRHYAVDGDGSLGSFFQDIAQELSGTRFMLVRAACPVDVRVTADGETLSSAEGDRNLTASFGSLSIEPADGEDASTDADSTADTIKTLRLREGMDYEVQITGTGTGTMDYSVSFADALGDYADTRTFDGIKVAPGTQVRSTATAADTTRVSIDEDGDGTYERELEASANGQGEPVPAWRRGPWRFIAMGAVAAAAIIVIALLARKVRSTRIRGN